MRPVIEAAPNLVKVRIKIAQDRYAGRRKLSRTPCRPIRGRNMAWSHNGRHQARGYASRLPVGPPWRCTEDALAGVEGGGDRRPGGCIQQQRATIVAVALARSLALCVDDRRQRIRHPTQSSPMTCPTVACRQDPPRRRQSTATPGRTHDSQKPIRDLCRRQCWARTSRSISMPRGLAHSSLSANIGKAAAADSSPAISAITPDCWPRRNGCGTLKSMTGARVTGDEMPDWLRISGRCQASCPASVGSRPN